MVASRGVGILALGVACLSTGARESHRGAALGLFVFNFGVSVRFAWVGVTTTFRGVLLWPAVMLQGGIAAGLLPQLLTFKITRLSIGEQHAGKLSH